MHRHLQTIILAVTISTVMNKEPDLPPCPTNIDYFPQNLPMHCKKTEQAQHPLLPFPLPHGFPGFPALPAPILPGFPGPESNLPLPTAQGLPLEMPGPVLPAPAPVPMPMPMQMPIPGPGAHKLPVIVMPFYSPDPSYKNPQNIKHKGRKRRYRNYPGGHSHARRQPDSEKKRRLETYHDESTSSDTDGSSNTSNEGSDHGWWKPSRGYRRSGKKYKRRHRHENKNLLTPILQYVTKDGYVIFEKTISKDEAKNWLSLKKDNDHNGNQATDHKMLNREAVEDINNNNDKNAFVDPNVEIFEPKKEKELNSRGESHNDKVTVRKRYRQKIRPKHVQLTKDQENDDASV